MDSSSRSLPVTPRTCTPSPVNDDDDMNGPPSPLLDDAPAASSLGEASPVPNPPAGAAIPSAAQVPPAENKTTPLKGKGKAKEAPLRLLDLPVDILKEIIQQLPHTNDLTSLALCHSALHRLAIPCIYSRFDIVWPDESNHTEPRTGVDALTYGLATLVMGDDAFPHQTRQRQGSGSPQTRHSANKIPATPYPVPRRRFGNYYAQFTKKFSLGNGPPPWVQEYMIAKEGGKMLGTLVALAVARMINLETFVWDMPTGVLRDVWLALSSLADRTDGDECRLDRLWIRWHDNSIDSPAPPPAPPIILNNVPQQGNTTHPSGVGAVQTPIVVPAPYHSHPATALDRVEHPTFSVIPALKSLSVLDIDELPYLDEMSFLIARSQKKLRELRVGIAPHAQNRNWVTAWEGEGIHQVDYSTTSTASSSISEKRLGGVLGILVGRVHNMRHSEEHSSGLPNGAEITRTLTSGATTVKGGLAGALPVSAQSPQQDRDSDPTDDGQAETTVDGEVAAAEATIEAALGAASNHVGQPSLLVQPGPDATSTPTNHSSDVPPSKHSNKRVTKSDKIGSTERPADSSKPLLTGKLRLEVLELERVPISVSVLLKAIDWSILTTLTLLNCNNHEQLWKSLRRTFTPRSPFPGGSPSSNKAYRASYTLRSEYGLSLRKIHTNTVSPSLISFLKETLAPNTLEVLFLQDGRSYLSTVTVDAIYRGPLRRHRASLKKLMIDSSEKGPEGQTTTRDRWRRWMLSREMITFITSGRMSSLRELAVSLDYKDWHLFLQRLPFIPHIRSLYIPFIADHVHGNNIEPRELAMQILDIVHLRPEIEICYMGISTKCFEILENRPSNYDLRPDGTHESDGPPSGMGPSYATHEPLSEDESEATEDEEDDDFEVGVGVDGEDTNSEISDEDHDHSDDDSLMQDERKGPRLRIREILFYEEKIETLRARHGTLKP